MKIRIAQLNPIVGDIDGNLARIVETVAGSQGESPDLVVFPELFLVGYPPRDLLEKPWFMAKVRRRLKDLAALSAENPDTGVLVGVPWPSETQTGKGLYNAAVMFYQGRIIGRQYKSLLPTYDVFDEARYFDPSSDIATVPFKGEVLGISVCEDAWNDPELWPRRQYPQDPIDILANQGASIFINLSASPFHVGKEEVRYRLIRNHASKHGLPFVFVNQVGGNDELIFDGRSMYLNSEGNTGAVFPAFREHVGTVDTRGDRVPGPYVFQDPVESIHEALMLGLRDYMGKCGFTDAVLGLSGGIDSALTCCLAAKALGPDHVLGVSMPSPYSSRGSVEDSRQLASNLGIRFKVIPISDIFSEYLKTLSTHFEGRDADVAEENIQARIRGNILMALSNKFGYLVLSTGNKSELAVGYCTLYGDMSGGLSVISDVPKTTVYQVAEHINRESTIIPRSIFEKPPSAELRPNQTDQDTLPPYEILDDILEQYIDENRSPAEIVSRGHDEATVKWVTRTVDRNEYKRRQSAPGLKVTTKAFGVGRRMPIAARFDPY